MTEKLYEIREREYKLEGTDEDGSPKTGTITMEAAFTSEGHYIGTPETAAKLCDEMGIRPELRPRRDGTVDPSTTCEIGFCERERKWYGWSYGAICGFGIGDVVEEGDTTATAGSDCESDHAHLPVGFRAVTLDDAKRMAIAHAECVS